MGRTVFLVPIFAIIYITVCVLDNSYCAQFFVFFVKDDHFVLAESTIELVYPIIPVKVGMDQGGKV